MKTILGIVMLASAIGLLWFGRLRFSRQKGVPSNLAFSLFPGTCIALFFIGLFLLLFGTAIT